MLETKSRLVLLIGDEGALLSIHAPRKSNPEPQADSTYFSAACDEPSEKKILDLIAQHAQTNRLTILLDTLAQDYRVESVPRINPFDRARIIRRRLTQFFPDAAATAALNLDSSRVGFAGWHAEAPLRRWLDQLAPYAPRVALLPIEGAALAPREEWALMISLQRTGGLRQIVTNKGHPIFTRLTPSPSASTPEAIANAVVQDLKTTLSYMNRLGLSDSRDLHVMALLPEASRSAFAQAGLSLRNLTLLDPSEPYGDVLFARKVAHRKLLRLDVTPRIWKKNRQDLATQRLGNRLSVAALLLVLMSLGWQAATLAQTLIETRQERTQRDDILKQLNKERAESAPITEPLGRLRAAVERERLYAEPSPAPWPTLDALERTLTADMRLAALDWQAPSPKEEPVKRDEKLRLTVRLSAAESREQWRARLQEWSEIVRHALPEFAFSIIRSPFPTTPQESLTGGTAESANAAPTADILLSRKETTP